MTEERPNSAAPTEVVVRVDSGRRRRPSLLGAAVALGVIGVVAVVGFVLASGWLNLSDLFSTRTTDRSAPVIVHKLRDRASLTAASGTFTVTVDVEKDVSVLPQFLAGSRSIYSGYGTVNATVDLRALDTRHVTETADGTLVVTLPHPRLESAVLDPKHSHVMNRDRGLLDRIGGAFVDSPTSERTLEQMAVQKMNVAAQRSALATRAERSATAIVERLGASAGFDKTQVRFV
jgi:hypothetical protein